MEIFLTIVGTTIFSQLIKIVYKTKERWLVERIMRESISRYKLKYPENYRFIADLNKVINKEMMYSAHLGMIRDGGFEDKMLNIQSDRKITKMRNDLKEKVSKSSFKYTVRDVMREYGCDEKLSKMIMNYQSGAYSGTEMTILSETKIGFDSWPADRILKQNR